MEAVYELSWEKYLLMVDTIFRSPRFIASLASMKTIYPVTDNDNILAALIASKTQLLITTEPDEHSIVCMNVIDTGETINKYHNPKIALISRIKLDVLNQYHTSNMYIRFPWENIKKNMGESIRYLIGVSGGNTKELDMVPENIITVIEKVTDGYDKKLVIQKRKVKEASIINDTYRIFSIDDSNGLPFYGTLKITYLPSGIAITNMAEIVDHYSHRFTNPNKLISDVCSVIQRKVSPKGIVLKLSAVSVWKKFNNETGMVKLTDTKGDTKKLWKV